MSMLMVWLLLPSSGLCLLTVEGTPQVNQPLRGSWHGSRQSLGWEQQEVYQDLLWKRGERKAMVKPGRGKGRMDLRERPAPSPAGRELSYLGA